jgi:hypothetical protein
MPGHQDMCLLDTSHLLIATNTCMGAHALPLLPHTHTHTHTAHTTHAKHASSQHNITTTMLLPMRQHCDTTHTTASMPAIFWMHGSAHPYLCRPMIQQPVGCSSALAVRPTDLCISLKGTEIQTWLQTTHNHVFDPACPETLP